MSDQPDATPPSADTGPEPPAGAHVEHRSPLARAPRPGYERSSDEPRRDRLREVLGPAWVGILIGVLLVQLAFIASYVGAFHAPQPHALTVAVVAPGDAGDQVATRLNGIAGNPLQADATTDRASAVDDLRHGLRQAVLVVDPQGTQDRLLVSSAQGASTSQAMQAVFQQVEASQRRTVTVQDVVPAQPGDARGLTSFYVVIGWLVGGYLMASFIGVRGGGRARNFSRTLWRLVACAVYAAVSGVGGALVVDTWLGAITGHFWQLVGIGFLLSLSASVVTLGLQALLGIIGIGVAIVVFVVLGNPSAGGAYGYQLLDEPWRSIGRWLPNGAGVDAVRSVVYLRSEDLWSHLGVIALWIAAGLLLILLVSANVYWGLRDDVTAPEQEESDAVSA
ncbi:hypothetical protein PZ938_18250 [Luteipulveratus sp. YIM 133132]|uniref:hypothetical protein n=1 Tax=Luteipulveratus flavus TaxID=3031728 RepID=UPI0023B00ACD|nr:hypothetical protein [Luteipulveratus sp. YIM 133132]MDE9367565.1 hypothetical protein [Luteipulveratus sp. YIM 133132]